MIERIIIKRGCLRRPHFIKFLSKFDNLINYTVMEKQTQNLPNRSNILLLMNLLSKVCLLYFALLIANYSTHQYLPELANAIISFIVELCTIPMVLLTVIIWLISLYHLIFKKQSKSNWLMNILYSSITIIFIFLGDYFV